MVVSKVYMLLLLITYIYIYIYIYILLIDCFLVAYADDMGQAHAMGVPWDP